MKLPRFIEDCLIAASLIIPVGMILLAGCHSPTARFTQPSPSSSGNWSNLVTALSSPERTRRCLTVMRAWLDGQEIEINSNYRGDWTVDVRPEWDWKRNDYRVRQ